VLQGTFDTLSLTEVLGLLAQSHKTGALWLEAGSVQGRVYLADGRCRAAESGELTGPVDDDRELATRLVDVCFSLARQPGGSFRFAADEEPQWKTRLAVDVDEAVESLDKLLGEWREIQLVIPSLESRPALAALLGADSIIIDQPLWRLLVALDGARTVRDVMHHTERSVLDTCNALKELVELGAVEILPEAAEAPAPLARPEATSAEVEATAAEERAAEAALDTLAHLADATVTEPHASDEESEDEPATEDGALADGDGAADLDAQLTHERHDALGAPDEGTADAEPAAEPTARMPDPFAGAEEEAEHAEGAETDAVPPGAGPLEEGDPRDRGALLRLFSALRDT
jgi:hypothetical protein